MELKKVVEENGGDTIEVIEPLEESLCARSTGFRLVTQPTEQGALLLEFIRKHLTLEIGGQR